jgi:RsiW-degrading membrane proteinase PrsW (M82 family)
MYPVRVILASVVPALIYLAVIRMTERYGREKWRTVLGAFLWGLISALIAAFLELFIGMFISLNFTTSAVLLAPVIEEITKPLIFFGSREREVEDGIIKGASAGIGFACLENILYFSGTESSLLPFIIVIRTIDCFIMHSAAAGFTGLGIAKGSALPYLLTAMAMHSLSNFLVIFGFLGIFASVMLSMLLFAFTRSLIKRYDNM